MSKVGSFIAIGAPTDPLPWPGAARIYIKGDDDNNWRKQVISLMQNAEIVVIRTNVTEGLLWEVGEALKNVDRKRILFLVSAGRDRYEEFRSKVANYFNIDLPMYRGKKNTNATVTGALFFDEHGNVQAHWFPGTTIGFLGRRMIGPLLLLCVFYLFAWSLSSFMGAVSSRDATIWGYVLLIAMCALIALPALVLVQWVVYFGRRSRFERLLEKELLPIFSQIQDHPPG
jgi:hypothetical protein